MITDETREALICRMVTRFLDWRLPANFCPDCCITFDRDKARQNPNWWPVGTNLFTAEQARQMIKHMLEES